MQKQISLGLTTSSATVNTNPTYFNQSGLSIDDLWLVQVDTRNPSIVSGMKSDGLASNGNHTEFLVNASSFAKNEMLQTILAHAQIGGLDETSNMTELL